MTSEEWDDLARTIDTRNLIYGQRWFRAGITFNESRRENRSKKT